MNYLIKKEIQGIVSLLEVLEAPGNLFGEMGFDIIVYDVNGDTLGKISMSDSGQYAFFAAYRAEEDS